MDSKNATRRHMQQARTFTAIFLFVTCLFWLGCDRASSTKDVKTDPNLKSPKEGEKTAATVETPESPESIARSALAREILDACFAKYKTLRSYEDRGRLIVKLPTKDNPIEDTDSMRIAYEAPNRLGIQALDLQALSTNSSWEAVVGSKISKPFGNQRLVRPSPASLDLKWLLVDNLGPSLDRVVSGTPIQIQLLFDANPLAYLFNEKTKLTLLPTEIFDGVQCDRVQITSTGLKRTLWIDQKEKLLRKYEMPIELLDQVPPGLPADLDKSKSELSIELVGVKANASVDWSAWQIPKQSNEIAVRRFIEAPPRDLPPLVGEILKPFDLRDADGNLLLDSAQRGTKTISVLCWVGDDRVSEDVSESFVKYVMNVSRELDRLSLSGSTEIIMVSTLPAAKMKEAFQRWNCNLPLAIDTKGLTQSLFKIRSQPAIVVLDKQAMVQHVDEFGYLDNLPIIVEELQKGVNRAMRSRQSSLDDESRFASRLQRVIVEKSKADEVGPIASFPFMFHPLTEAWHASFDAKIIAAGGEQFYPQKGRTLVTPDLFATNAPLARLMTVLDELGNLTILDSVGNKRVIASIPIEKADNAKRIHILPDPWAHRWVAIVPEGLPRYWLVEMPANLFDRPKVVPVEAIEFPLGENESPIAFVWTVQGNKPSLSIATDASKLHVLDPEQSKPFKGSAVNVAAIVPTLNDRGECIAWNVVDFDRQITEIEGLPSDDVSSTNERAETTAIKKLPFAPELGAWTWGRSRERTLMLGMAQLPSGETGSILQNSKFEPLLTHPLSVRADQCRNLSSTILANGNFYWLSTAPRRVLHLQTSGQGYADQMSLGKPILSAAIFPDGDQLRMVVAVDNEVVCWKVPVTLPTPMAAPATSGPESVSPSEKPRG